jgi:hypothetical protein
VGALWKTFGPRALGIIAGFAATKLGEVTGTVVDPATLIGLGMAAYAIAHRAASSKINPGDAATGRVAEGEKRADAAGGTVTVQSPPAK